MRTIDRSHLPTLSATKTKPRASRNNHPSVRRLSPQLIADGVVAGYIHDISIRHRDRDDSGTEAYGFAPEAAAA